MLSLYVPHQIKLIKKVMKQLHVKASIVLDFIQVLDYLWKAVWCFFDKGDEAVEQWIAEKSVHFYLLNRLLNHEFGYSRLDFQLFKIGGIHLSTFNIINSDY